MDRVPMTGRGAGFCAGYSVPGYANAARGSGSYGFRLRRRKRLRNQYYMTGLSRWARGGYRRRPAYQNDDHPHELTPEEEISILTDQARSIQRQLDSINERLRQMKTEKAGEGEE